MFDLVTPELTNHCNYACASCPHRNMKRQLGYMDLDLFDKIFTECQSNTRELNFSYFGEPMLHPRFLDFLSYMKTNRGSLILSINTNLSCATREILEALIDVPFNQIRFSIDAATSETYVLTRPAEFTLDLEGQRYNGNRFDLIEKKMLWWHSQPDHLPTRHVYTVSSRNIEELPLYADKWIPLFGPQDDLFAKRMLTYGGKVSDPLISPHSCNIWDLRMAAIDWQGNVSPCNLDIEMELTIGNIRDNSLEKLFASPAWDAIRRRRDARDSAPCRECVDSNAWSETRNLVLKHGDKWNDAYWTRFRAVV